MSPEPFLDNASAGLANLLAMLPFAILVRHLVVTRAGTLTRGGLATILPGAGALFALGWYWSLTVLLAVLRDGSVAQFRVLPFHNPAAAWQILQGLAVYSGIIGLAFAELNARRLHTILDQRPDSPAGASRRYFLRNGDQFVPLDVDRIVSITGADDYAEIVTRAGRHLIRVTLAELEQQLGLDFIRIHRSRIVNVNCISRVETAGGGRVTLLLDTGEWVQASRSGSRLIRDRII